MVTGATNIEMTPGVQGAELLAVAADPIRWRVLTQLTGGETCVCDLQQRIPIAANLLSYHLKVLRETGMVTTTRRGRWIDYTLAVDAIDRLRAALPGVANTLQ